MLIRKILEDASSRFSDKTAIIFKEDKVSFSQLREQVLKCAGILRDLGVVQGDRVAVYLPNCLEYIYGYLACFCLGAVAVPLDFMLKADELTACLDHAG